MTKVPTSAPASIAEVLEKLDDMASDGKQPSFREMVRAVGLDPGLDFVGASLHDLDFRGEDLRGFDFSQSDLTGADFRRANITGVSFADADLTGAIGLFGYRLRDFDAAPEMIVVPADEFLMGSRDGEGDDAEHPQHKVTIKSPFAVSIAPITRSEFAAFIEATHYKIKRGGKWSWRDAGFRQEDDHPVVRVNWYDALAYVAWLRERSGGNDYRLLSEAEWEYCCRAGTTSAYSTGDAITAGQANFGENGTTPVSRFPANRWGLRDMHGNVWEWCEDTWHKDYNGNPPTDGSVWWGGNTLFRVLRGGSWLRAPLHSTSARPSVAVPGPPSCLARAASTMWATMSAFVLPEHFNLLR
jgi:formylglycine-generating enzyme required for sulfatase activity